MSEEWPVSEARPDVALPRVEQLPRKGAGYEPESVQEAFDAFYRHIARLDSTLRTLEAVEAFGRQAGELRDELRAFRRARWDESWDVAYGRSVTPSGRLRPTSALPRIAAEVAFLIAVAVFLGVGHFEARTIVVVMAAAWLIVGLVEFVASRPRGASFVRPESEPGSAALPPPADAVHGWPDDDGLTMVAELEPSRGRALPRAEADAAEAVER
jgi:hypothetical protein